MENVLPSFTKQNFFDEMMAKYPAGVKVFRDWLTEYKTRPDSYQVFHPCCSTHPDNPDFHDLPGAMQVGIWIQFIMERGACSWEIEDLLDYDWKEDMAATFRMIEEEKEAGANEATNTTEAIKLADENLLPNIAASSMRTPDEIRRQIYCLMAMLHLLPDRWNEAAQRGIEAQIAILTGEKTSDYYEVDETADEFEDADMEVYWDAQRVEVWLISKKAKDLFDANELPDTFKVPALDAERKLVEPLHFGIFGSQPQQAAD